MPRKTGTEVSQFPEPGIADVHAVSAEGVNISEDITLVTDTLDTQGKELKRIRQGHERYLWEEEVEPIE